jgi:hypothetical protein
MADLPSFFVIDVKYLEIKSMNPKRFGLVKNFRICAQGWYLSLYWGNFFSPEKQGVENGLFSPFLVIFLFARYQVPLCISMPSNDGSKCRHGF